MAAFLILAVVVPAASASAFRRPSLLNDASHNVGLTLEGPKPQFHVHTSLEKLDDAIKKGAEGGWLKMLGVEAESWEGLKQWVAENWGVVVEAAVKRLG